MELLKFEPKTILLLFISVYECMYDLNLDKILNKKYLNQANSNKVNIIMWYLLSTPIFQNKSDFIEMRILHMLILLVFQVGPPELINIY